MATELDTTRAVNGNAQIVKGISGSMKIISDFEKKIAEVRKTKVGMVKAYRFKCKACLEYSKLETFKFVRTYSVDMDSDWSYHDDDTCMLCCGLCGNNTYIHNSSQRDEFLAVTSSISKSIYAGVLDRKSGSEGKWY
jgi:hypothetical protein